MMTRVKIAITDDPDLRDELDREYESASQKQSCVYALKLAARICGLINFSEPDNALIREVLEANERWQKGLAGVPDVRRASFRIHQRARTSEDALVRAGLRAIGHAVAAAHMREHAMVASDYAIKVTGLLSHDNMEAIRKERRWQIKHLKQIRKTS